MGLRCLGGRWYGIWFVFGWLYPFGIGVMLCLIKLISLLQC